MATVVDLLAKFRADSSQFTANITKARADIEAFEKSTQSASKNINQGLDQVNKRSVAVGAAIGTAIGQIATQAFMKAGQAAKQFVVDSIGGASDLNESTTKTEAVFGSATDTIMKFASGAATAIGQSKQQALDAASTFGIYGRSAGLSGQALADFAMTQTALASDLASFYNTSPEDAIVALGAAFRGQAEPARAFGVLMDDMSMRAAAFKMGIISSTKEALTPQNKVLAANALIMEQTKVAQGDFSKTSAGLANQQRILAAQLANTKTQFGQALLPTVLSVVAAFNTQVLPAFTGLAASFKTLIEEIAGRLAPTFENLKTIIGNVITAVTPLVTIIGGLLAIAFVAVTSALDVLLPIVSSVTGFFAENEWILVAVASAVGLVAAAVAGATIAFKIKTAVIKGVTAVMKVYRVAQVLMTGGNLASIASTNTLAASMLRLNAVLRANPIGAVITVIMLLVSAFILAWKKSETFRNVVAKVFEAVANVVLFVVKAIIGYIRMMVNAWMNVAGFILKGAEKAFGWIPGIGDKVKAANKGFAGLQDGVNETFDGIIAGAEKMKTKIVNAVKGAAAAEGKTKPKKKKKKEKPKPGDVPAITPDPADVAATGKEFVSNMKEIVQDYNDFINGDFKTGFMKGADSAKNTIEKSLDIMKKVFEDKSKQVGGAAGENIMAQFDKLNDKIRAYIPQAQAVAAALEKVEKELQDATKRLEDAIKERTAAMGKFGAMLRTPFGEPSEINKALSSAEASVDSIIGMYDKMVEAVNQRFTDLAPGARDAVLKFLETQTSELITAAKNRVKAVKKLEKAQDDLKTLLEEQAAFQNSISSSMKSFGTALIDMSSQDGAAVLTVSKTATGLVISQIKKSVSAVDMITKQLQDRLKQIGEFGANINKLLAKGLNKDYIRQLLDAGPEAAGQTAAALAVAGAEQVAEINSLYSKIDSASQAFGDTMGSTFYDNAVKMANGLVEGAQAEVDAINAQMTLITNNIKKILAVLGDTGLTSANALIAGLMTAFSEINQTNAAAGAGAINTSISTALNTLRTLGTSVASDLAQGLFDKLTLEKARLVTLAESIAAAIAAALAGAAASIGVVVDVPKFDPPPVVDPTVPPVVPPVVSPSETSDIPPVVTKTTTAVAKVVAAAKTVIVKTGDTLTKIAKANGTTVTAILAANPKFTDNDKYKGGNLIFSGTTVKIPGAPVVSPTPIVNSAASLGTNDAANWARTMTAAATPAAAPVVNVVINKNIEDSAVQGIMTRAIKDAMEAR